MTKRRHFSWIMKMNFSVWLLEGASLVRHCPRGALIWRTFHFRCGKNVKNTSLLADSENVFFKLAAGGAQLVPTLGPAERSSDELSIFHASKMSKTRDFPPVSQMHFSSWPLEGPSSYRHWPPQGAHIAHFQFSVRQKCQNT